MQVSNLVIETKVCRAQYLEPTKDDYLPLEIKGD